MGAISLTRPEKENKLKPEIWLLDDLIKNFQMITEDAEFDASKNIKNPKQKRHAIGRYNYVCSILKYLKELQKEKHLNR